LQWLSGGRRISILKVEEELLFNFVVCWHNSVFVQFELDLPGLRLTRGQVCLAFASRAY
jgi:hypothetical protein